MKKFYFVAVFTALVALYACSNKNEEMENNQSVETVKSEISVGLPIGISRTAIDEAGKASWTEGDTFALWAENSAGELNLSGAQFLMMYYWHSYQSAVFTSKIEALNEGIYNYYAVAPTPQSVSGYRANYTLPVEQLGGAFNGAYDIMVATPISAEALSADEVNALSLDFEHKMHVFRVDIVENNLGTSIEKLQFTFPTNVTGDVALDVTNGATTLSSGTKNLTITIPEGANVNDTVWGVVYPQTISGNMKIVAIGTDGRKSKEKSVSLSKECLAGHITPLALSVPNPLSTLRFTIGTNNLGEKIEKLTITDNNGSMLALNKLSENTYDYTVDSDSATVFDHYKGKTFTATFESKNAVVSSTFTMPTTLTIGVNTIPALTVPYLLFEDFSCIHTAGDSYGDNTCSSDERKQPGVSLDSYMDHKGWNAARFMLGVGTCPRINVRYQVVKMYLVFQSSHHGRLDTPPMTNLKSGAKVKLRVQFDAGGVEYKGDFTGDIMAIQLATHTNLSNPIDGIPTGISGFNLNWSDIMNSAPEYYSTTLNDYGLTQFSYVMSPQYGKDSFGSTFPTINAEIVDVTRDTRLVFYPTTNIQIDGIGNDECAVYIDNIRVSIISE